MRWRGQHVGWLIHVDVEVIRNDVMKKNRQEDSMSVLKILMNEGKECINVYFKGAKF